MVTKIYVFSGTGNSYFLARELGEILGNTEIIRINKDTPFQDNSSDCYVVVYPTYMFRPPHLVMDFLERVFTDKPVYFLASHGGGPGLTLSYAQRVLKRNEVNFKGGIAIRMPSNYIPWEGAEAKEKQEEYFFRARKELQDLAEKIKTNQMIKCEKPSWFQTRIWPGLFYILGYKMMSKMAREFKSTDKCTSCGVCERICPVGNIELSQGKPLWGKNCQFCFACLQWCPEGAIELGNKTQGKDRYHQPAVSLADLGIKN